MRRNTAIALSPVVVKVMPVKLFKAMVREDGFLQASAPCHHTTAKVCVCVTRERERERGLPRLTSLQAGLKASGSYVEARAVSELDETLDAEVQKAMAR